MAMARFWEFGVLATFHALTPGRIGYILYKILGLMGRADCSLDVMLTQNRQDKRQNSKERGYP